MVLLRQGRVKVFCTTLEGREPFLAVLGAGELVGELAAIDGDLEPRVASVIAIEEVTARVIPAREFLDFLATRPQVAIALMRTLTARLRVGDRRRVEFGGHDTTHRLATLLVEMADEHGVEADGGIRIDVPLSQDDLGGMVGASRESVARSLARLRSRGLVQTQRRGIKICDIALLRRYGG